MGMSHCVAGLLLLAGYVGCTGEYLGGSMRYAVYEDNGKMMANVTVLTGWRLGTGPCGHTCKIGQTTSSLLHHTTAGLDENLFGQWDTEEKGPEQPRNYSDITHTVNSIIHQYVIAINRREHWELELGTFTLPLADRLEYIDIKYFGNNMTRLSEQTGIIHSYMQMKIDMPWKRSDTRVPNRSPLTDSRPFMRLALGRHYRLRIPTVDPDLDYVTCRTPVFVEFLELFRSPAPNVTVNKNCTIDVFTDPSQYRIGDTALVGLVVQDYPRQQIHFSSTSSYLNAYGMSLSQSPIQFTFEIADVDDGPVFLSPPSPPDGQVFTMYQGTNLSIEVFAEPSGSKRTITSFRYLSDSMSRFLTVANVRDRDDAGPSVKSQLISWVPRADMTGVHSLCVTAQDSDGFESQFNYCFSIEVKEYPNATEELSPRPGVPHFVNFPQTDELNFPVNSIGLFPISAGSTNTGNTLTIQLTNESLHNLMITSNDADPDITKVTVQTSSSSGGKQDACFQISDGISSLERCTNINFLTADPCERNPCVNSGKCVRTDTTNKFRCQCIAGFQGYICDKAPENPCASQPCNGGQCFHMSGTAYKCVCLPGKTGALCDNEINQCRTDCVYGVCEDRSGNSTCHCAEGFTGKRCTGPDNTPAVCPGLQPNTTDCTKQCNWCFEPHGICRPRNRVNQYDECTCSLGYEHPETHCQRVNVEITAAGGNGPKFVPPTPGPLSTVSCELDAYSIQKCSFPVYATNLNTNRTAPVVENLLSTNDLRVTVLPPQTSGISNVFMYRITVKQSEEDRNHRNTYTVCLKVSTMGNITDRTCVSVDFTMTAMPVYTSAKYLEFVEPTLPRNSEFSCRHGKACHIFLYTERDHDQCERIITDKNSPVEVFSPKLINGYCVTDVAFRHFTIQYQRLCFRAGLGGESRCFGVILGSDPDTCNESSCDNGGVCVPRAAGSHRCICQQNYFGPTCQSYGGKTIDINGSTTDMATFYPGAFPINATCFVNCRCFLNVFIASQRSSIFSVSPGYTDIIHDELSAYIPKDIALGRTGGVHLGVLMVRPTKAGHGRACIQIRNEMGGSIGERCSTVVIQQEYTTLGSKLFPYFMSPSPQNNTIYECILGSDCNIMTWTQKADNEVDCPKVQVMSARPDTIGVIEIQNRTNSCVVDVILRTQDMNETTDLCLKLRSKHVEDEIYEIGMDNKRCYRVSWKVNTTVTSPCASVQCHNGGYCDSRQDKPTCLCPLGFSGQYCQQFHPGNQVHSSADRPMMFADDAFPSNIVCQMDVHCSFVVDLWGPDNLNPDVWFDHVHSSIIAEKPIRNPTTKALPGIYSFTIAVNGTKVGTFETILQTSDDTGRVTDELWYRYEIRPGSTVTINRNQPHFISPSFPSESTIKCSNERLCHIVLLSETAAFYQCPRVAFVSEPRDSAYIFQGRNSTSHDQGGCMADVALLASDKQLANELFCFRLSLPTVPGEKRCYRIQYGSANL